MQKFIRKDTKLRKIAVPCISDKILQTAVLWLLLRIVEPSLLDHSYAFKYGRSQHDALKSLKSKLDKEDYYLLKLDIKDYFNSIDHTILKKILDQHVKEPGIKCLISKWLTAEIKETNGKITKLHKKGIAQGMVLAPLLSNLYGDHIIGSWFEFEFKPKAKYDCFLIQFCDAVQIYFNCKIETISFAT